MLNLESLLSPISADAPSGEDLSFSLEFDRIQEQRRADDPSLDQGEWQIELKAADWPGVLHDCQQLLCSRSKDLRLAAWFTEAASYLHGITGLNQGLALTTALCEQYWPQLHPLPQQQDQEERIGVLDWLLSNCRNWLQTGLLVSSAAGEFSQQNLHSAPPDLQRQLLASLQQCSLELNALQQVVDTHLGSDGPDFSTTRERLQQLQHRLQRQLTSLPNDTATHAASPAPAPAIPAFSPPIHVSPGLTTNRLNSRQQALQQLRQVAEFFRQTEPHSPVAYLAEKAARWGELPLHEWLQQVIKDPAVLQQLQDALDLEPRP